jgi:hypothetical protein
VPGGIGIGHGFLQGIVVAYGNNRTGAHPLALCAARSARHTATSLPQAQLFDLPSPTGMKRARRMAKCQVGDLRCVRRLVRCRSPSGRPSQHRRGSWETRTRCPCLTYRAAAHVGCR